MPARNTLKVYVENGFYHIYNRGVEKRSIFQDDRDYKVFLNYIKEILSPVDESSLKTIFSLRGQSYKAEKKPLKNYYSEVDLVAYCLMPNHFHFLIHQKNKTSIEYFMRALMTRYSMYFNKKYNRVGTLFQGRYKAVLITGESYLLHLTRYIHLNPGEFTNDLKNAYSSYSDYLGIRKTFWIKTGMITALFDNNVGLEFKKYNSYKLFVEGKVDSTEVLGELVLE